jgi:signal transduction histidine kinase
MKLQVIDSQNKPGRVYEVPNDGETTIGRGNACSVCLEDSEASRRHARIIFENERALVEDLNSKNGTRLNGHQVFRSLLTEGDELSIGTTLLRITDLPSPPQTESTLLRMRDTGARVVIALPQVDADILIGRTLSLTGADLEHENHVLREICRITQLVAGRTDRQTILQTILREIRELLDADTVCLLTRATDGARWEIQAHEGSELARGDVHVSQTIIRQAIEEEKSILSTDPLGDSRFDGSQSIAAEGLTSAICSPVRIADRFGGALFVDRRRRVDSFTELDLRLTASVANILGMFLAKEEFENTARQQARLAAVGEAMASLAHYIKNVITGFRLTLSMLGTAVAHRDHEKESKYLGMLGEQERRISDLMLNMLSYVKDRVPERKAVEVRDLVRSAVEPLRSRMDSEGIVFDLRCDPVTAVIQADETSLYRIFLNLMLNTLDAFESKRNAAEKRITLTVTPLPGGGGMFVFRDTACGIPPAKLSRIFDAFYSTKGSRGTGLGLAVVQKLVREHGGELTVASVEGEWTEFHFSIPLTPANAGKSA